MNNLPKGADPIGWQDIRLVAGEGKLSASDVFAAVEIILKQRRERELYTEDKPAITILDDAKIPVKFVVWLQPGIDHEWIPVTDWLDYEEAVKVWNEKTKNGTENTTYNDIDYYKIERA